jgi:transcription elongation factor GreA
MKKVPLTVQGAERLRAELHEMKTVRRPRAIRAIADARSHGDLRENAEYHAAREEQSFVEGRIAEIESKLAHAQVIDVTKLPSNGKVVFGATVELADEETGQETRYQIVGEDEADIRAGRISVSSPIARAIIGKEEGDVATVQAPGGVKEFEIVSVKYV